MLVDQGGVEEELLGKGRLDMSNGFPVGWAEVSSKRKAYLEEQVVCKDIRERTCDIRMMLDLADTRLDVIGTDDDVIVGA
jgi:hypothetical protein